MASGPVLRCVCLASAAALALASGRNGTSKADLAGPGHAQTQNRLRQSGRASAGAANPCAACPHCVSVTYARQISKAADVCAPCAMDAQSSWPCNAEPAQCQCGSGPAPTPAPTPPPSPIRAWFTSAAFEEFFPHMSSPTCTGSNFFTYEAFLEAAGYFPGFAGSGDLAKDKLELAAFFGQTGHATSGGWPTAPGGPFAWGYCWREEMGCGTCHQYCKVDDEEYPCVPGESYQGRGPMMLTWNYNYGAFSEATFGDKNVLLSSPAQVANNPVLSFKSALWFWMTPQSPKPSCHDAMTGAWQPSPADRAAGRTPGFGMTTNVLDGGSECNKPAGESVEDRVGFYKRFAGLLGVAVNEDTLYCESMAPYP